MTTSEMNFFMHIASRINNQESQAYQECEITMREVKQILGHTDEKTICIDQLMDQIKQLKEVLL